MNVIKKSCFAGLGLGLILLVSACMPVFLYQKDYSFYDADFALSANSVLRTDGFYVFEGMAGQQGNIVDTPEVYEVYKFYKSGQVNFLLTDTLQENGVYLDAMKDQIEAGEAGRTLFQGYYKIYGDKIIIEQVNTVTTNFIYSYALVDHDTLTVVKKTIEGGGAFSADYFSGKSTLVYRFTPDEKAESELSPNW